MPGLQMWFAQGTPSPKKRFKQGESFGVANAPKDPTILSLEGGCAALDKMIKECIEKRYVMRLDVIKPPREVAKVVANAYAENDGKTLPINLYTYGGFNFQSHVADKELEERLKVAQSELNALIQTSDQKIEEDSLADQISTAQVKVRDLEKQVIAFKSEKYPELQKMFKACESAKEFSNKAFLEDNKVSREITETAKGAEFIGKDIAVLVDTFLKPSEKYMEFHQSSFGAYARTTVDWNCDFIKSKLKDILGDDKGQKLDSTIQKIEDKTLKASINELRQAALKAYSCIDKGSIAEIERNLQDINKWFKTATPETIEFLCKNTKLAPNRVAGFVSASAAVKTQVIIADIAIAVAANNPKAVAEYSKQTRIVDPQTGFTVTDLKKAPEYLQEFAFKVDNAVKPADNFFDLVNQQVYGHFRFALTQILAKKLGIHSDIRTKAGAETLKIALGSISHANKLYEIGAEGVAFLPAGSMLQPEVRFEIMEQYLAYTNKKPKDLAPHCQEFYDSYQAQNIEKPLIGSYTKLVISQEEEKGANKPQAMCID